MPFAEKASVAGDGDLTSASAHLDRVLFVVVSCTRDPSRERAFGRLIKSLNREHERVGFRNNLMLFDNASHIRTPTARWKVPAIFADCAENVGYWSALKWSMDNAFELFGRQFDYIHPIESDLVLYKLDRLGEAVRYLDGTSAIQTVRTQEFSIANRNRYFKGGSMWFARRRSLVADYNGVTETKVAFEKVGGFDRIYESNWHAKVPALHRWSALLNALDELAARDSIDELQFMQVMQAQSERVGVLDGGIYYALLNNPIWPWEKRLLTGSWSDPSKLKKAGYRPTRQDSMGHVPVDVKISHSPT